MVDQRNAQIVAFHARRRPRRLYVWNKTGGWFAPGGELPSQRIEKARSLRRVWIEETLPVKMPGERR